MWDFKTKKDNKETKKIKRGDADWRTQSSLPDACWLRHIVLRHCASTRAAAMFVSHISMCHHLTHSCDTIHIPAALSLPPYQWTIITASGYMVRLGEWSPQKNFQRYRPINDPLPAT